MSRGVQAAEDSSGVEFLSTGAWATVQLGMMLTPFFESRIGGQLSIFGIIYMNEFLYWVWASEPLDFWKVLIWYGPGLQIHILYNSWYEMELLGPGLQWSNLGLKIRGFSVIDMINMTIASIFMFQLVIFSSRRVLVFCASFCLPAPRQYSLGFFSGYLGGYCVDTSCRRLRPRALS